MFSISGTLRWTCIIAVILVVSGILVRHNVSLHKIDIFALYEDHNFENEILSNKVSLFEYKAENETLSNKAKFFEYTAENETLSNKDNLYEHKMESKLLSNNDSLLDIMLNVPLNNTFKQTNISNLKQMTFKLEPLTPVQRLKGVLKCHDQSLELTKFRYGKYWLLKNYVIGKISRHVSCAETITYTTNGDYSFIGNLEFLLPRWQAPVSFAIFAPGYDFDMALSSIQYARNCLANSEDIRNYVTFHIYFPTEHMPKSIPLTEKAALEWPFNCQAKEPPYASSAKMYKTEKNLLYPINVGRNIARKAANTHFILASDVELYPTPDLVENFLEMVDRNPKLIKDDEYPRVFVLPVFEVVADAKIPSTKSELKSMLKNHTAIPFHAKFCSLCHRVPEQEAWIKANNNDSLSLFSKAQRKNKYAHWEPFYISDNQEPLFDERVTWEGQSNKRIQAYAMCLLSYEYYVLHPPFLVHSPGIKIFDKNSKRLKYVASTNHLISSVIVPEYKILYGRNSGCKV